jgi:hypothetical protein
MKTIEMAKGNGKRKRKNQKNVTNLGLPLPGDTASRFFGLDL